MSLTIDEWNDKCEDLTKEEADKLMNALKVLEQNKDIKEHFNWTGIFLLKSCIEVGQRCKELRAKGELKPKEAAKSASNV